MYIKVKEGIKGTKWSEVSRMSSVTVTQKGSAFEQILSCGECLAKDQSRYQQSPSPCEVGGNVFTFIRTESFVLQQKVLSCSSGSVPTSSVQSLDAFARKTSRA